MPQFLVFFVHRYFDFRYPELEALLTLQGIDLKDCVDVESLPDPETSPVLQLTLPSETHAKYLSERGILIKGVYEVWGHSTKAYDDLVAAVAAYPGKSKADILNNATLSWRINVDAFGKKLSMTEQTQRRDHFRDVLPFQGPVALKDPDQTFLILEEYVVDVEDASLLQPKQLFFLRELAGSERNRGRGGARDLVDQQTLKRRAYIGPTSMESEMALIMSNMALVQTHDLVIDPFVGTGSVLIPCATHGAVCFGTDIDIRVLLGTGVGVNGAGVTVEQQQDKNTRINILTNFQQYSLPPPELIRADNSLSPLLIKCRDYFDAIVCDPPYGIRAGARKSGRKRVIKEEAQELLLTAEKQANYIPPTQPYAAQDVMNDLLEFAAQTLKEGGRLVYLLPTTYEYTEADLPTHPKLRVIANSEQKLTLKYARRLITMVKSSAENQEVETVALAYKKKKEEEEKVEGTTKDASFANLREKILEQNRKKRVKNA